MAKYKRTMQKNKSLDEQNGILFPTGVPGLDTIFRGGLMTPPSNRGLIILIKGRPGTGKTTLALQMAANAQYWDDRNILVESYEQSVEDIKSVFKRFVSNNPRNFNTRIEICPSDKAQGQTKVHKGTPINTTSTSLAWAREIAVKLNESSEKKSLVIVDGLNFLGIREHNLFELEILVNALRNSARVGIIVYEPERKSFDNVDFLSDTVIELRGEELDAPYRYFLNHLNITKSRFQASVLGWHQYKIRDEGLIVFPSIHYYLHEKDLLQARSHNSHIPISKVSKTKQIIPSPPLKRDNSILGKLLGPNNIKKGSCSVILGPRRTWKTLITLDFLRAGSKYKTRKQTGLLVSLLDNQATIVEQRDSLCEGLCVQDNKQKCKGPQKYSKCYSEVFLLHFRPGCIAPGEFFHFLDERLTRYERNVKANRIERLVFWDLTQLEYRFPNLRPSG